MVEFEPPKRKALSESELHHALTRLGNTSDGLVQAEVLLSKQASAREEDTAALAAWISQMQALGTPEAQRALTNMVLDVMPAAIVETQVDEEPAQDREVEPVFTSEISIIQSRRALRGKRAGLRNFIGYLAGILLLSLSNALISVWLELNLTEALVSAAIGLVICAPIIALLKSHPLHPLLRSAAVFGGWGVYVGAGLMLATIAVTVSAGSLAASQQLYLENFTAAYNSDLLVMAGIALVVSQTIPRSWFFSAIAVSSVCVIGFEIAQTPNVRATLDFTLISVDSLLWGSLAMGLVSAVIYAFGQPHLALKTKSLFWQLPLMLVLSAVAVLFASPLTLPNSVPVVIFLAIALSGRDLSAHALGRFAGIAFLIAPILTPWIDMVSGPAVAILSSLLVLIGLDQLFRTGSLHIPSLDTSYGFYGSFQPLTFTAILFSSALATRPAQDLAQLSEIFSHHELALITGLGVGSFFALLRIFSIRKQDQEIRNVEFRNMNLDNLLGL